ncbi:MAG: sigma-70 family RNA polymerase sigma factor [Anaerolineales bacterium]|nr:sigma-70 family RNA polymerase sigma factor [Anaerolineales bacterium]
MIEKTEIDIDALRKGDREEFALMVDTYSTKIYRLALRMMGNEQEAEDILQETFLNAYRALPSFEGRSSLGTWLYRIASNQALMRLRKKNPVSISVDDPVINDGGDEIPRQFVDWCCLPEKELMTTEVVSELDNALDMLSSNLRTVFILRDVNGLSTRETAQVLNISEAAVKTRLLRGRLKLRETLSSYFSERIEEIGYA